MSVTVPCMLLSTQKQERQSDVNKSVPGVPERSMRTTDKARTPQHQTPRRRWRSGKDSPPAHTYSASQEMLVIASLSDANMHGPDTSMSMILRKEDEERRLKANLLPAQASLVSHIS